MSARVMAIVVIAAVLVPLVVTSPANANGTKIQTREKVVREWNEDGTAAPGDEVVGTSRLWRGQEGLVAKVKLRGLEPGGAYTFWWVVVQDDGTFPEDIHVQRGAGVIVGKNGKARVHMTARTGDEGIDGFPPLAGAEFADLSDPKMSTVRVEIAYHGQARDAGGDLPIWLSDFWTGTACPPDTANPNPNQPHCPVYFASTHTS